MHKALVEAVAHSVTKRKCQGDCPTEPVQSVEMLEEAVLSLYCELHPEQYQNWVKEEMNK